MDDVPTKLVVTPQPESDPDPFYYFKIRKPKQAAQVCGNLTDFDELNFDNEDDGFTGMDDEAEPENDEE